MEQKLFQWFFYLFSFPNQCVFITIRPVGGDKVYTSDWRSGAESDPLNHPVRTATGFQNKHEIIIVKKKSISIPPTHTTADPWCLLLI